jgi:predicted alpha/beta superfamily hydrolase
MIQKKDFIYTPKGKNRPLHIYLPDDYETSGVRYPVMYFFDGHNLFSDEDATFGKCWGLKEFLDGWDQKIILVGIECGHEGDERLSEYLPYKAGFGPLWNFVPMGAQTMDWIVHEIKPMIDVAYRTMPGREHTAIGGSSMGGLMSLFAITRYNRWFSKAACVSSAVYFGKRRIMADLKSLSLDPDTRVFLSWGTREAYGFLDPKKEDRTSWTYALNKKISRILESKGARVMRYCQVGGKHCEADWEKQNPIFMDFLWK